MSPKTKTRSNEQNIRYADLERQYGEITALALLVEMERHVRLNSDLLAAVEPEARLQVALALMNEPIVYNAPETYV